MKRGLAVVLCLATWACAREPERPPLDRPAVRLITRRTRVGAVPLMANGLELFKIGLTGAQVIVQATIRTDRDSRPPIVTTTLAAPGAGASMNQTSVLTSLPPLIAARRVKVLPPYVTAVTVAARASRIFIEAETRSSRFAADTVVWEKAIALAEGVALPLAGDCPSKTTCPAALAAQVQRREESAGETQPSHADSTVTGRRIV